jgi:hypothetical protein
MATIVQIGLAHNEIVRSALTLCDDGSLWELTYGVGAQSTQCNWHALPLPPNCKPSRTTGTKVHQPEADEDHA